MVISAISTALGGMTPGTPRSPYARCGAIFEPACPADPHPFDPVKEAIGERPPVDADFGDQRLPVVLEPRDAHRPPRDRPANRLALVQPQAKANPVIVLPAH